MNNHRNRAYLYMIIVSVIWGFAGPVIKFTLGSFPPIIFLAYRLGISTVIAMVYWLMAKPHLPKSPKIQTSVFAYGLFAVTIGLGLLFYGFDKTSALTGSLLSAMSPLAIIAASALFLHERVSHHERIGVSIALLGTLVIIVVPLLTNGGASGGELIGNLLVLASIAADTIATILIKVIVRDKVDPQFLAHLSFVIGFITIAPFVFILYSPQYVLSLFAQAPLSAHLGVWFMAIFSGTIAYTLRNIAIKTIEVSEAAVFSYLYPVWAAPLSVLWLGENITPPFLIGSAIITIGVYIAEIKKQRKKG